MNGIVEYLTEVCVNDHGKKTIYQGGKVYNACERDDSEFVRKEVQPH